ncbi:hypothetical protein O1R50_24010 [Glycomyces luteolus]|uniref:Uncharacterized protein n=1 Tax=Glycomyces luteolus TaxID=2670330 RepID=A0A9X3PCR6_9ACTN|nr:hypothetical protein [Glycomyces luteolus]MDA1362707.1 hypothetical protein [Glycomyces luteolus]
MERTRPLNERQLKVLGLVGGGDDLGDCASVQFRNSARALESRGLVAVNRSGSRWQAVITEAGRFYLEHGAHPEAGRASADAVRTPRQRTRPADDASSDASPRYGPPALKRPTSAGERYRDAVELVERLRAERIVDLLSLSEAELDRWRKTIDYAKRHGLVPEGHRIECNHPAASTMTVRLVAATHPTAAL